MSEVAGLVAVVVFVQSRSLVLDCALTLGQPAQCHDTPAAHIQFVILSGLMAAGHLLPMYAGVYGLTAMLAP